LDTTALDELIAQVRGTVTALAEAEKKVATVRTELSDENYKARLEASSGLLEDVTPIPKAATSGWVPADQ
jgi:predicted phage tail protein